MIHELAFEDYSMTGVGGGTPAPQNFQEWSDYPPDGPPTTEEEVVMDVIETLAGTGGTISLDDLSLITPEEWEAFLAALLGYVNGGHGADQNSYYNDHSNEAPLGEYFIQEWGWLPSVQQMPGYHYFDYLTQDIDPEFLEWAYAVHSQADIIRETGMSLTAIENQPFTLWVGGTPIRVVWHSGTPPVANLNPLPGDSDTIVVTASLGYFTVTNQHDGAMATVAADYVAWTPDQIPYMQFVNQALTYLAQSPLALQVMWDALEAGVTIKIVLGDSPTRFNTNLNQVEWNPGLGYRLSGGGILSPAMCLIHELAHGINRIIFAEWDAQYGNTEDRRVIENYERAISLLLGEPTRQDHHASPVRVPNVTYHTPNLPPPG